MTGTTGNNSSSRAPARYSGTGGPGTLVTTRFTDRCRGKCRYQARWPATNRKIPLPASGALEYAGGGLGGDQRKAAHRVGLPERQRHHHPPGPVAAGLPRLLVVQGDWDHGAQYQPIDRFTAACEQLAQARGHRGQDHVVDLGLVEVGDLPGEVQAAADDGQPAVGPDRLVEAGPWGALFGEDFPPCRPGRSGLAQRPGRMGQARPPATELLAASAQVVAQQLPGGRDRGRRPQRGDRSGRVGVQVKQGPKGGDARGAVGEGVVQLQERAHPPLWQTGEQPQLPQWPGPVQPPPGQLRAGLEQLGVVGGRAKRLDAEMVGEVEAGGVDPQWPAQPRPRSVQQLPKRGTRCSLGSSRRRTASIRTRSWRPVQQGGAVQDGQPADLVGPAIVVPQQHEQIRCGQPFQKT